MDSSCLETPRSGTNISYVDGNLLVRRSARNATGRISRLFTNYVSIFRTLSLHSSIILIDYLPRLGLLGSMTSNVLPI